MFRNSKSKRSRQFMLMVLAVLVAGITATGYADLAAAEQVSGPGVVGTLTLVQSTAGGVTVIFSGQCRGKGAFFAQTLPAGTFTISPSTTPESLKSLTFVGTGQAGCPGNGQPVPSNNLFVNTVVEPKFNNTGSVITAEVVLLFSE
jgi:hypothetical protein